MLVGAIHSVGYGVENPTAGMSGGCGTCATVLRFFDERLKQSFDGKLGDILVHSKEKVVLYMGHSIR